MCSVGSGMVLAIGDLAGATFVTLLAATEDVATLLDVGTAVYGEGHSRPAQPHSRPSTAAGENAPRQDIPLIGCGASSVCIAYRHMPECRSIGGAFF